MLPAPSTFNPNVPFTSQMAPSPMAGYPNASQSNMGQPAASTPGAPPMNQIMGNPQTQSYSHGGKTRKRSSMIEVYMSPDEIAKMVEAQGGADHDRLTGRHMFKKLSRFIENPHMDRAIREKFAIGGNVGGQPAMMGGPQAIINQAHSLGMARPGFANGGTVGQYNMPPRAPQSDEQYARGGDTEIVYITPHMKKLFDSLGKGSINPVTGHPEYFGLSDLWSGIKSVGSSALSGLNSVAPQLAQMAKPLAEKLPGAWGQAANAALDYAPGLINSLNNYVNPSAPPPSNQTPQDAQQNQAGFAEMPFGGEEGMQEHPQQQTQRPSFAQHMGNYAQQAAGQMGGPGGQAAQAGIRSMMGGRGLGQTAANMFGAGTQNMRGMPGMDIARSGAQAYGRGASPMDAMKHMGGQAMNQFMGRGSNNDRRAMESQYLDQIYKQPQQQNAYA